jgi:hypothetical protein
MKKIYLFIILAFSSITLDAQLSKAEVEAMMKTVNFQDIKDVYLIRTRERDGAQGWFEKFEEFDPKTCKITYNEKSMIMEGSSYEVMVPYDKIKIIFYKKANYLTIEMID